MLLPPKSIAFARHGAANVIMDYIIIVAGGKGMRMGADIPKQFLLLGGRPILMRTMEQFYNYSALTADCGAPQSTTAPLETTV